jgi:hypothetical protein
MESQFLKPVCKSCKTNSATKIIFICANCGKSEQQTSLTVEHYVDPDNYETGWMLCSEKCEKRLKAHFFIPSRSPWAWVKRKHPYYFTEEKLLRNDVRVKICNLIYDKCILCNDWYCSYCGSTGADVVPTYNVPEKFGPFHVFCTSNSDCWNKFEAHAYKTERAELCETPYVYQH